MFMQTEISSLMREWIETVALNHGTIFRACTREDSFGFDQENKG